MDFVNFHIKRATLIFIGQDLPKVDFGVRTSEIWNQHLQDTMKDKTDNFENFGLNFAKLPNFRQYFGSFNFEGVAESWVEANTSWLEVDGAGWRWMELVEGGWRWVKLDGAGGGWQTY